MVTRMNKKTKIITIIITLITLVLVILFTFSSIGHPSNTEDNNIGIPINNFTDYYKDIPTNTQNTLSTILYKTTSLNSTPPSNINASITNKLPQTFQYNAVNNTYKVSFTVEIAELNQSYDISFEYSKNTNTPITQPIKVSCPSKNSSIYPDFRCKDLTRMDN